MKQPVVCQRWPFHDSAFKTTRKYTAWYGHCSTCGAKVVVPNKIKKLVRSGEEVRIVCDQCAELP